MTSRESKIRAVQISSLIEVEYQYEFDCKSGRESNIRVRSQCISQTKEVKCISMVLISSIWDPGLGRQSTTHAKTKWETKIMSVLISVVAGSCKPVQKSVIKSGRRSKRHSIQSSALG